MRPNVLAEQLAGTIRGVVAPLIERVGVVEVAGRARELTDARLATTLDELAGALRGLRERLDGLEARAPMPGPQGAPGEPGAPGKDGAPGLIYRGAHELGTSYEAGDCVYAGGSSWVAVTTTRAAPSTSSPEWGLLASRGRDGKREPPRESR